MAPVEQYVFAEMLRKSEHFTAGSHEWLPYSVFPTFPIQSNKQQFTVPSPIPVAYDIFTLDTASLLCYNL